MKILCGIVLYNPNIDELISNLRVIEKQVDKILLVNNDKTNLKIEKISNQISNLEIMNLNENKGIAYALNVILNYSIDRKYDFTLTLDQDSQCHKNMIQTYIENLEDNVALYTPQIVDLNKNDYNDKLENKYINMCITSGCFMNIGYVKNCRGFDNDFFIDFVDFDFSLNVIEKGYKIKFIPKAILYHHLGNAKKIKVLSKILKKDIYTFNHNSFRTFYYNRNAILLIKKHPNMPLKKQHILSLIKWDVLKILFEDNKISKLKSVVKGLYKGFKEE